MVMVPVSLIFMACRQVLRWTAAVRPNANGPMQLFSDFIRSQLKVFVAQPASEFYARCARRNAARMAAMQAISSGP
jgi:hypothetical protein